MKQRYLISILIALMICLGARSAWAVIIFLRDSDEPIHGLILRETEQSILIKQILSDGSTQERTILRTDIDDLIQTVAAKRLEALQPDQPDAYRDYAEELAEKSKDPEARETSLRLFLIAAHIDPDRLGRSCLLAMVPLARNETERRTFRAMAYLLDPRHDPGLLSTATHDTVGGRNIDPELAEQMLSVLRMLRAESRGEALALAKRVEFEEHLAELTDTITFAEFEQACEPICVHCKRGRQTCPKCKGRKFISRSSCSTCSAKGEITCPVCQGSYRNPPLPSSLLKRIVQLELDWLPRTDSPADKLPSSAPPWSWSVQQGEETPLPPFSLESITEFDPRQNVYHDGKWTS